MPQMDETALEAHEERIHCCSTKKPQLFQTVRLVKKLNLKKMKREE